LKLLQEQVVLGEDDAVVATKVFGKPVFGSICGDCADKKRQEQIMQNSMLLIAIY
jgi:hypothetical protein